MDENGFINTCLYDMPIPIYDYLSPLILETKLTEAFNMFQGSIYMGKSCPDPL